MTVVCLVSSNVLGFQSLGRESFGAGAMTGGIPSTDLQIRHTPITKASPITREVVILGETGSEVPPTPPPYEARLTTDSNYEPVADRAVRVTVFYRYVSSLDPAETVGVPETTLGTIEGPEPTSFAFEIPQSSVTTGFLQYRILSERLVNGASVGGVQFPVIVPGEPIPYVNVGVTANASQVFGIEGGRFVLSDGNPADGETVLDIPKGLLSGPTEISFDEVPLDSPIIPPGLSGLISVYRLSSSAVIRGLMQISLLYQDFTYPQGQDGVVDGTSIAENNIAIQWWDGFAWRRIGGAGNARSNTLSVKIGFFGFLGITAASPLSPEARRPLEKIITPNGDGVNDTVTFAFGDLAENVKVEIFDITNHRVKTIMSLNSLQWDGRDDSGQLLESGVYIYQYEVEGKRVSGLIAIAK